MIYISLKRRLFDGKTSILAEKYGSIFLCIDSNVRNMVDARVGISVVDEMWRFLLEGVSGE